MSLFSTALRFLKKLAELLQSPQTNARLIVVMLGIIVIVIAAILIVVYLVVRGIRRVLYPPKPAEFAERRHPFASEAQPGEGDVSGSSDVPVVSLSRERPQYTRLAILVGSFFGVVLMLMILGGTVTSASGFCGKACHSMNPVYQSWSRSSHAQVACVSCHDSGNVIVNTGKKYSAVVNIFKELSGRYARPINADSRHGEKNMDDSACVKCHLLGDEKSPIGLGTGASSKVFAEHRKSGLKCVTCHNRVAHERAEQYDPLPGKDKSFKYLDYMKMKEGCLRCHKRGGRFFNAQGKARIGPFEAPGGATAGTACSVCHKKGQFESTVKVHGDITTVHADARKQGSEVCLFCHGSMRGSRTPYHKMHLSSTITDLECVDCHERVEEGPRGVSGKIRVERKVCLKCHVARFAAYTEMHIARSWAREHRKLKGFDTELCMECHRQPELDFCGQCHEYHPHGKKWVNGGHGRKALASVPRSDFKSGSIPCLRCHDKETWCTTQCHKGLTVPHDELRVWHRDEVRADRERCRMCHKDSTGLNFCGKRCHHEGYYETYKLTKADPWKSGKTRHGVVVKAEGVQSCLKCHDQSTWCTTQCHQGITMPHAGNWRGVHFKTIPSGTYKKFPRKRQWKPEKAPCNMCHNKDGNNPDFCFTCHHKQFFPSDMDKRMMDWRYLMTIANEQFGTTYNLENSERCAQCHDVIPFCRQCHGVRDD